MEDTKSLPRHSHPQLIKNGTLTRVIDMLSKCRY